MIRKPGSRPFYHAIQLRNRSGLFYSSRCRTRLERHSGSHQSCFKMCGLENRNSVRMVVSKIKEWILNIRKFLRLSSVIDNQVYYAVMFFFRNKYQICRLFVHNFTQNQIWIKVFKNQTEAKPKQEKQFCKSLIMHKLHLRSRLLELYKLLFTYSAKNSLICLQKIYTFTERNYERARWTYVIGRQVQSCYAARCPSGLMSACKHWPYAALPVSTHGPNCY